MATRRDFLAGAAALAVWPAVAAAPTQLMSAARVHGVDGGALWTATDLRTFALPARGHAPASLPSGRVVLAGRQPGVFAAIADANSLSVRLFEPARDYRFGGHAAAHSSMRTFATGEYHGELGNGLIVIRDGVTGLERARWDAGGIGPHDLVYSGDGSRLVVALGGLLREPNVHNPPMDAGAIESSIVELDAKSGRLLKRHKLAREYASLSLRHLALAPDGETIAFAMQDQELSEPRPVVGILQLGRGLALLSLPADSPNAFRGYIGSVAVDAGGRYVAATSPRGGFIGLWSLATGRWLGGMWLQDACGLTSDKTAAVFWVTSGLGNVVRLTADQNGLTAAAHFRAAAAFDNHVLRV